MPQVVDFTLIGKHALLMHADDLDGSARLDAWRKAPENKNKSVAGDDRSPPWTWQTYTYNDGTHLCMPSANVMVALRAAGAQLILKKQKTFKEISQSGLLIDGEMCEFFTGPQRQKIAVKSLNAIAHLSFVEQAEEAEKLGFKLFAKRARIGQAKHVRVRPRFEQWEVRGTVCVRKDEITFEILEKMFELAGSIGLCDWRPGCKTPGPFGQFTSELKQVA